VAASLNDIDSNGMSQQVIDAVEQFRVERGDPTNTNHRILLTFDMAVSQRDAEYIMECLRILLQDETSINQATSLSLDDCNISDETIEVFGQFLSETSSSPFRVLYVWKLPPGQVRRLLAALHTNTSVKQLCICMLRDDIGASWIADLLRHKTDFRHLHLDQCRFPVTNILPVLRGQPNL
jgi:hypothetical protein